MKHVFDLSKLQLGDIILIKTYDSTCERIRKNSGSNFSHAMIFVGKYSCLESNAFGVRSVNPQRFLFSDEGDASIFRLKNQDDIEKLIDGLHRGAELVGTEYASTREVYKSLTPTSDDANEPRRQYCTRFVAQIYDKAGFGIVANPDYCSPYDIESSQNLVKIENSLKVGTEEEIEIAKELSEILELQSDATYSHLNDARAISDEDLQSLDDIDEYLLMHPEHDESLSASLITSKYLELGDMEKSINPHFYDFHLFLKKYGIINCIHIAFDMFRREQVLNYNFQNATDKYKKLHEQSGLKYFDLLFECYQKQTDYSSLRLGVFQMTLVSFFPQGLNS